MTIITRPVTDDGLVGYDQFGQFVVEWEERHGRTSTFVKDVRGKTCVICNQQWKETGPSIKDQLHWSLINDFVHQSCYTRHLGLVERSDFDYEILKAGFRHHGMVPIVNQYWGANDDWSRPWYRVELVNHPLRLTIGWRKRVISIELEAQGKEVINPEPFEKAFADEQVTKEFGLRKILLHAWGMEKAKEYLTKIAGLLGPGKMPEER